MSNITKIIFILIVLIAIALLLILYIVPNLSKSIETGKAIETEREDNKAFMERLGELLLERDEYNALNAKYQKFSLELPSENNTSIFTDEVYDIAKYANVNIISVDYAEKVTSLKVKEESEILITEVILSLEGSYYNILNFIRTMEKMPRIVIIGDIILQSTGDEYERLSASIIAEIYYKI
ncbi:MAG: type 4a pilus biogenesis protein PilO [Actinobacteria bacterium]|nr:type 4a pilus biogenesis protein PilO [Chloroflexota bacterium]MBE3128928.1 type 4a pilus biogenesis protein PilO [Actinomycetota bacterium]